MDSILRSIIATEFQGLRKTASREKPAVLRLEVRIALNDTEEGYRHAELLIRAPSNYVEVWYRTTWNVIPQADLDYDADPDEPLIKPGKDYVKGASEWRLLACHDSCWPDGIDRFFTTVHPMILTRLGSRVGAGRAHWYSTEDVADLPER